MTEHTGLAVRRATPDDLPSVIALLRSAMHRDDDVRFDALFRWKHLDNAFGPSPAWIALDGDRVAGVRYLMRWQYERDGDVLDAVRAVDTATDPAYQGRGLFTRLTLAAIEELRDEGIAFVFNTPNDQSRPGYLKMGWSVVGRLPVSSRPLHLGGAVRMLRARTPAAHFSTDCALGVPATDVLADERALQALLDTRPRTSAGMLRTHLTPEVLRWRYGGNVLRYRAVVGRGGLRDGVAFVRVRARGPARELAVALVLAPDQSAARRVMHDTLRGGRRDADYAIAIGARPSPTFVPVPRTGPLLTWRAVAATGAMPPTSDWQLTLGDIEVF